MSTIDSQENETTASTYASRAVTTEESAIWQTLFDSAQIMADFRDRPTLVANSFAKVRESAAQILRKLALLQSAEPMAPYPGGPEREMKEYRAQLSQFRAQLQSIAERLHYVDQVALTLAREQFQVDAGHYRTAHRSHDHVIDIKRSLFSDLHKSGMTLATCVEDEAEWMPFILIDRFYESVAYPAPMKPMKYYFLERHQMLDSRAG